MAEDTLTQLIKILGEFKPETLNGAVILHLDKDTKQLKSISPLCPVESVDELYRMLSDARDGIQSFLNDLVDKGIKKGGQSN